MDITKEIEDLRGYFNKTILGSEQQTTLRSILDILFELYELHERQKTREGRRKEELANYCGRIEALEGAHVRNKGRTNKVQKEIFEVWGQISKLEKAVYRSAEIKSAGPPKEELKPCLFCKCAVTEIRFEGRYFVVCSRCYCCGPKADTEYWAAVKWNLGS